MFLREVKIKREWNENKFFFKFFFKDYILFILLFIWVGV